MYFKRFWLSTFDNKIGHNYMLYTEMYFKYGDIDRLRVNE